MSGTGGIEGRLDAAAVIAATSAAANNPTGLMHMALRHGSTAELVASVGPFVHEALRVKDPLFINLPPDSVEALKGELGHDADRVRWSDATRWNPHPVRRLRAIRELVDGAERHGSGRLRLITAWPSPIGVPAMVAEWERFDALLNNALGGLPVTLVCSFDTSTLPTDVVERVSCSHPFLGIDPVHSSPAYLDPEDYLADRRGPRAPIADGASSLSGQVTSSEARALIRRVLGESTGTQPPVPAGVVEDMALAITELVTNAWEAGAHCMTVTCWRGDGEVGAQVDDDGPGLGDILAGYRWPGPSVARGRGLWVARQLVDVLDATGTTEGTSMRACIFDASWETAPAH